MNTRLSELKSELNRLFIRMAELAIDVKTVKNTDVKRYAQLELENTKRSIINIEQDIRAFKVEELLELQEG